MEARLRVTVCAGHAARKTDISRLQSQGILEQSVELSKRLLASAKHVGVFLNLFRRGGSEKRKVGVLFSGGIDAVAVLVALRAWGVPCVTAVAGFTGGVEYVLGLSQILTKQCFISNAPVTVQTDGR